MVRRFRSQIATLAFAFTFATHAPVALPEWTLEIAGLQLDSVRMDRITLSSAGEASEEGGVDIRAATVFIDESATGYGPFTLSCPGAATAVLESLCQGGSWRFTVDGDWPELEGTVIDAAIEDQRISLHTHGNFDALSWSAGLETTPQVIEIKVQIPEQPIDALGFLETTAPQLGWVTAGRLKGSAEYAAPPGQAPSARADLEISGIDFDSPDGLYAGLGVGARLLAQLDPSLEMVFDVESQLSSGELLLQDFYRNFSEKGLDIEARLGVRDEYLDVQHLSLGDGGALHLAAQARLPTGPEPAEPELLLRELRLEFPEAYTRYLEPVAAVYSLDGLQTEGVVSWSGERSPGTARSGELSIQGLSVTDAKGGRFGVKGLNGTLRTGSESSLTWAAARFEKLDLGGGEAHIALAPESVSLRRPLRIPVFGGSLALEELSVGFPREGEPDIRMQAMIEGIEMQQMSRALGWPEFSGTLEGHIPGITWTGEVIAIQGDLDFQVFGGHVVVTDLRVERPFGVLPSLAADVTASDLDLEELTRTFEFGQIAGRVDGYVRDLRMLDWRPVRFDAWFGTTENSGRRHDISRQAVQHMATIGGGSSTAMLSGPVLRLFNNFSYRRLGLGCRLSDNVCHIRGIDEQGDAVLLLEGAGIPKISILAYNRAVDWPQLVAELSAVSGGDEVRIGE